MSYASSYDTHQAGVLGHSGLGQTLPYSHDEGPETCTVYTAEYDNKTMFSFNILSVVEAGVFK